MLSTSRQSRRSHEGRLGEGDSGPEGEIRIELYK